MVLREQRRSLKTAEESLAFALAHPELIEAEKARRRMVRSFAEFVRGAWHVLHPTKPLDWNWHLQAICDHLTAVSEGLITKIVVNIPPGFGKSMLVSVFWPAWQWLRSPSWSILCGSYDMDLSRRDSQRCRDVITSEWYQETFFPKWGLKGDRNTVDRYKNTMQGERQCVAVGAGTLGKRGDCLLIDDPHNAKRMYLSEADRLKAIEWFDGVASNRLNDMRTDPIVIIMQRLHDEDLTGHVLKEEGWCHLNLPAEYDPERHCETYTDAGELLFSDPRTERGELLFPLRFPREVLDVQRKRQGTYGYATKYLQLTIPSSGGIIKKDWIQRYDRLPDEAFDRIILSIDCSHGSLEKDASYNVFSAWGQLGSHLYLLDLERFRGEFPEVMKRFLAFVGAWPEAEARLLEYKAMGRSIAQALKRKVPSLILITPDRSKVARVRSCSPFIEGGGLWVPRDAPWAEAFVYEVCGFTGTGGGAANDDQVDVTTQVIEWSVEDTWWDDVSFGF